ncbi:MAG: hypothetical protein JJ974_05960 [Phycisphaerales bacterium]|nr:hypothetical protein [Phycisphaerales bacterium]
MTKLTTAASFCAALMIGAAASTTNAQYTSAQVESPQIIEINPAAFPTTRTRGVQVRYSNERGVQAGTQDADGSVTWNGSQREAMGGQDAPARILIRVYDGVFSIDPFVPIGCSNEDITNMLFNGTTLETNRALFNRQRIERTEKLLKALEAARHDWLRNNGYYGVRSFTSSKSTSDTQANASTPEPAARFRIPAEAPRGRSIEQVEAEDLSSDKARAIAASLLSGHEPIRISLPMGTAADVVASVEARNTEAEISEQEPEEELASND